MAWRRATPVVMLVACACTSSGPSITLEAPSTTTTAPAGAATVDRPESVEPTLVVDIADASIDISPLILGVSGDADGEYVRDSGITLLNWGGENVSRFNYLVGNASNRGVDGNYQNHPVGLTADPVRDLLASAFGAGIAARIAVPTLGWVASDADPATCSFPLDGGGCGNAEGASCQTAGASADPASTSVVSSSRAVASWIGDLASDPATTPRFIAFDNEPELWGITHHDVHPTCTTYEEILLKYVEYASAIRAVAPAAELMGPVMCCWFDYWHTAPGPSDGSGEEFLQWFLRKIQELDLANGDRLLDVLDVKYYPQADVVNDHVDTATAALRLRSTRSLYDPLYTDESWVSTRIRLLPRLNHIVESSYPGTRIAISEWNWGAGGTMNGALAIADVLGIYGREGVYLASHSDRPEIGSPGYFAFKMFGNYDGRGGQFGGRSLPVVVNGVDGYDDLGAFAAYDPATDVLRLMLINKRPDAEFELALDIRSLEGARAWRVFRYGPDAPDGVTEQAPPSDEQPSIVLPPYSISLVEVSAAS